MCPSCTSDLFLTALYIYIGRGIQLVGNHIMHTFFLIYAVTRFYIIRVAGLNIVHRVLETQHLNFIAAIAFSFLFFFIYNLFHLYTNECMIELASHAFDSMFFPPTL